MTDEMNIDPGTLMSAKSAILKRLGYRIVAMDGGQSLIHLPSDGSLMSPTKFPDFISAINGAWDDAMERYELYIDRGANFHRKLHLGRSAASGKPAIVVEQLWPFDQEVLVFEPPDELTSLRALADELKSERAANGDANVGLQNEVRVSAPLAPRKRPS
jgi:hypothetical protein